MLFLRSLVRHCHSSARHSAPIARKNRHFFPKKQQSNSISDRQLTTITGTQRVRPPAMPRYGDRGTGTQRPIPDRPSGKSRCASVCGSQAETCEGEVGRPAGLHDRTAKSAEKAAATAQAPGAGVRTTAAGAGRGLGPRKPARFSALSFKERAKEDREAKIVGNPPHTSLNDHERLRCFARSFRAFGMRQLLRPTFSHRGDRQAKGLPKINNSN